MRSVGWLYLPIFSICPGKLDVVESHEPWHTEAHVGLECPSDWPRPVKIEDRSSLRDLKRWACCCDFLGKLKAVEQVFYFSLALTAGQHVIIYLRVYWWPFLENRKSCSSVCGASLPSPYVRAFQGCSFIGIVLFRSVLGCVTPSFFAFV